MKRRMAALLLALLCLTGCGGNTVENNRLTERRAAPPPSLEEFPDAHAAALTDFSLRLLRESWEDNVLVSPLSVLSALGMTANGARGETLAQMESVLGLPLEDLNRDLAAWTGSLAGDEALDMANAVWIRDDGTFTPEESFLDTAGAWYGAEVFAAPMDSQTLQDVNRWVESQTHGMIDGILDAIPAKTMMYLINALALEAEWMEIYREDQVREGIFTTEDGRKQTVEMMASTEGLYLEDACAGGFLKPYKDGRWAFAALLPKEGMALEEYAASLTGEGLYAMLAGAESTLVAAEIPKFQCACKMELSSSLKALGMTDAFDMTAADLSGLGSSSIGPLYVSQVLHKTCLTVDEKGTRAGAATAVAVDAGGAELSMEVVVLDRPFLCMLVDLETNLPVFLGAVTDLRSF